jgi:hypothetical protein
MATSRTSGKIAIGDVEHLVAARRRLTRPKDRLGEKPGIDALPEHLVGGPGSRKSERQPEHIRDRAVDRASDDGSFISGQTLHVNGGQYMF